MKDPIVTPFECVDPSVGESIWRLEEPDVDPQLRAELLAHVSACHACRLLVRLDEKARELAKSGSLELPAPPGPAPQRPGLRPRRIHVASVAGLALAACLAAILLTPPQPVTGRLSVRGNERTRFLRPVEGEVVSASRPVLRWTPLEGASRYFVEIRDEDGAAIWQGESESATIRLPGDVPLESGRNYKALLSVQPADLLAPGQTSVLFRSDGRWREALHRLRWTHPFLQWTSLLALGVVLLAGIRRPRLHAH